MRLEMEERVMEKEIKCYCWNVEKNKAKIGFGIHTFNDPMLKEAFYEEDFEIDVTQFHTYAAEWTPEKVVFYIDGKATKTIGQAPQYPMQFMLGVYEIPDLQKKGVQEKYPKEFVVEYVRAYQKK